MLKIGEFSRLSQVTVKTLHHYDEIGLFKPSHIDDCTGYRYYTLEQLPRLHRIMMLKELGLSLEQIRALLETNLGLEQLRGMLALKQAEVQQRVDEEVARLARVKFHLRQIELEAKMSELDIVVKTIEPMRALSMRKVFASDRDIAPTRQRITTALAKHEVKTREPYLTILHADLERGVTEHNLDMELVVPVEGTPAQQLTLDTGEVMNLVTLPAIGQAATYLLKGSYYHINDGLVDLQRWVVANGYKLSGSIRVLYLRGPMHAVADSEWLAEIQYPLEKA
jgi:DNA-binding transcriptional MerR regulator